MANLATFSVIIVVTLLISGIVTAASSRSSELPVWRVVPLVLFIVLVVTSPVLTGALLKATHEDGTSFGLALYWLPAILSSLILVTLRAIRSLGLADTWL